MPVVIVVAAAAVVLGASENENSGAIDPSQMMMASALLGLSGLHWALLLGASLGSSG